MKAKATLNRIPPLAFSAILLMGGGCSKDEVTAVTPVASRVESAALLKEVSPKQIELAWHDFVDRVERGEIEDPLGQYVSKKTVVDRDAFAKGSNGSRPKYNASLARRINFTRQSGKLEIISPSASSTNNTSLRLPDPDNDPPQPCPDGGCVGVPMPPVPPLFVSSVGRGGGGSIHDLKIVANSAISNLSPPTGYEILNLDLNRGAGGSYIAVS